MFKSIQNFLGKSRFQALIGWLAATGIISIVLRFVDAEWSVAVQTGLVIVFLAGVALIVGSALDNEQRLRGVAIVAPALGLLILGLLFFPNNLNLFAGGAVGWVVAGALIFGRMQSPQEYRKAIKALRSGDYDEAVKIMDGLIKIEPDEPNHYRFRAELLRLAGKLGRARNDYEKMEKLAKNEVTRAVAFNGLAELELQSKNYQIALQHAQKAYELAPNDWVTAYNMGMIQDRLNDYVGVVDSLNIKLKERVPDARHRLLIHFYLARAWAKLGNDAQALQALQWLKRDESGLDEWEKLLADKGATTLRDVLAKDIATIKQLTDGVITIENLR